MDVQKNARRFDEAISTLPPRIRSALAGIPRQAGATATEVRLRVGRPVAISCPGGGWFVDSRSQLHNLPGGCFAVEDKELSQAMAGICNYSVQSHQHELAKGYISLRGGHRAGICGTAVTDGGRITAVREVTSINLRIAREVKGAADPILEKVLRAGLCGLLILGPPSSGKTTVLRDLARQMASGGLGRLVKVAVVDERCELGAVYEGIPQNDLGVSCDILSGYPKGPGILMAVRTMSPDVIVCDEIGAQEEVDSMLDGLNCGVKIVASAHADSLGDLLRRPQVMRLVRAGAFTRIVRLGGADHPGQVVEIIKAGDLPDEADGTGRHPVVLYHDRDVHGLCLVQKGGAD